MKKSVLKKIKNNFIYFLLFIITIFGFIKRIDFYPYALNDDIGRDLFISKFFLTSVNTNFFIRPTSTLYELPNTPFYFWVISLIYLISRNITGVIIIHSALHSLLIPLVFLFLKKISNNKIALMASFFISLSPTFIQNSLHITQYSLIPIFITLSITLLVYSTYQKKINPKIFFCSIACLAPALFLHNSAIPIFIGFSFIWIKLAAKQNKKFLNITYLSILITTITFFLLSYQSNIAFFPILLSKIQNSKNENLFFLLDRLLFSTKTLWQNLNQPFSNGVIFIVSIVVLIKNFKKYQRQLLIFLPILCLFLSIALPIPEWYEHYFCPTYLILLFLFLCFSLSAIDSKIQNLAIALLVIFFLQYNQYSIFKPIKFKDPFINLKDVSTIISQNSQKNIDILLPLSNLYNLPHISNWFSPSAYLFLPSGYTKGIQIVDSTISSNNISHTGVPHSIFLICIEDKTSDFLSINNCLQDWNKNQETKLHQKGSFNNDGIQYQVYSDTQ